ncbi:MAG: hypothetical protein ACK52I_34295 [Pseudomonadota bacterium]
MTELTFKYKTDPVQGSPAQPPPPPPPKKPSKWAKRIAVFGLIAATIAFITAIITLLTWVIRAWLLMR